jgi:hypothetical protein
MYGTIIVASYFPAYSHLAFLYELPPLTWRMLDKIQFRILYLRGVYP